MWRSRPVYLIHIQPSRIHARACLLSVHERISQSLFAGPQPSLIPHPVIPRALRLASFCARATTDLEAGPWPASQATPNHLHSTSRVTCASNAQSPVPPAGECVMLQEMLPVAPRPLLLAVCRLSCTTKRLHSYPKTYLPTSPTYFLSTSLPTTLSWKK